MLPKPGLITDLSVVRLEPDDFNVRFTLDSGETVEVRGREVHDPPVPFADAFELWAFLVMQGTPEQLVERELHSVDPQWEAVVARRRPRGDLDERREQDRLRRAQLRSEFRRKA